MSKIAVTAALGADTAAAVLTTSSRLTAGPLGRVSLPYSRATTDHLYACGAQVQELLMSSLFPPAVGGAALGASVPTHACGCRV
jgi:hypothetical protein